MVALGHDCLSPASAGLLFGGQLIWIVEAVAGECGTLALALRRQRSTKIKFWGKAAVLEEAMGNFGPVARDLAQRAEGIQFRVFLLDAPTAL